MLLVMAHCGSYPFCMGACFSHGGQVDSSFRLSPGQIASTNLLLPLYKTGKVRTFLLKNFLFSAHFSLETSKRVIGKQCRLRSDAA